MAEAIRPEDVRLGDFLLHKDYRLNVFNTHGMIRAGEAVFSHNTHGGSSNSVHASIAVQIGARVGVAQSGGKGLNMEEVPDNEECLVFRYVAGDSPTAVATRAADLAVELVSARDTQKWTDQTRPIFGDYNHGAALASILPRRPYTPDGSTPSYVPDSDKAPNSSQSFFCSMFVVACFQRAAQDTTGMTIAFPSLDANVLCPKALEAYLRAHPVAWQKVGRLNKPAGNIAKRWGNRLVRPSAGVGLP